MVHEVVVLGLVVAGPPTVGLGLFAPEVGIGVEPLPTLLPVVPVLPPPPGLLVLDPDPEDSFDCAAI